MPGKDRVGLCVPLDALEVLARQLDSFRPLVEAYRHLAHAAKGKQAAVYHFLGGMVLNEQCKDPAGATAAFNASLDSGSAEPRILGVISKHFEKTGDWEGVAKTLWQNRHEKKSALFNICSISERTDDLVIW